MFGASQENLIGEDQMLITCAILTRGIQQHSTGEQSVASFVSFGINSASRSVVVDDCFSTHESGGTCLA